MLDYVRQADRLSYHKQPSVKNPDYLAQIVPTGPIGQPDFSDARYWVRQIEVSGTEDNDQYTATSTFLDNDSAVAVWAPALHIGEINLNTHSLLPGTIVRIFELRDIQGRSLFYFQTGGQGSSTVTIEVRIAKVLEIALDATNPQEYENFLTYGPHLKCYQIGADAMFLTEVYNGEIVKKYVPVFTNWMHPLSEFDAVAWNPLRPDAPVFHANLGLRGYTLAFGEGEQWVPAPSAAALCEAGMLVDSACCLPNETCTNTSEQECLAQNGTYHQGVQCLNFDCTAPGACCEGTPGFAGGGTGCTITTATLCMATGGVFHGPGTNCVGDPCITDIGACCALGICINRTAEQCAAVGGTYHPNELCSVVDCPSPPGACCQSGGICSISTESECEDILDGIFYIGGTCSPNPCSGACCMPAGGCQQTDNAQCNSMGGLYQGDGTSCSSGNICPVGACCAGGACTGVIPDFACLGDWYGQFQACVAPGNVCTGACCTGPVCTLRTPTQCASLGGVFHGNGTTCLAGICSSSVSAPPSQSFWTRARNWIQG